MLRHLSYVRLALTTLILGTVVGCSSSDDDGGSQTPNPPAPPAPPPPATPGDTSGLTSSNRLITFDRGTRAVRTGFAITGLQNGENVLAIDIRAGGSPAGELHVLGSTGRIYTVNATTGAATLKSTLAADAGDATAPFAALDGTEFGIDFNPVADRLRIVSNTGQSLRVNVDTGATITDDALNSGGAPLAGVSAVGYTNAFDAACRTTLYYLDIATDQLLSTSDPAAGAVTPVGALGVDADGVNGFEISTAADGTNTAVAALTVGGAATLYTIDLATGVAASLGAFSGLNPGETVRGVTAAAPATAPAQAAGNVIGLLDNNRFVSFTNAAPQKLCTAPTAITGLQAGETLRGIDRRPANDLIYAFGTSGRIYTLDPAAAAATLVSTLSAAPTDTTDPYTAVNGTQFAMDFTPVLDALRTVSDTGQNLRIEVDTGVTITDATTNPAGSVVVEGANINSVPGAAATLMYLLDSANDRLMIIGRPSGNPAFGDLVAVGALGVGDIDAQGGFDIVGATNATFAALSMVGASTSDLHTVNLTTGAATRINTIGGGERVRSLAITAAPLVAVSRLGAGDRIVSFKALSDASLASGSLGGLQGGERIAYLEDTTAGERLAVSDGGRVYRVDLARGVATLTEGELGGIVDPYW